MDPVELIPSAKRLITSLRDMGYDFSQAVADIIDNSITAEASLVAVDVEFDGDDSWVRIADDGKGMTPAELREALRYGAERDYEDEDLGKFGLGLKTASMSQCQRLTVASRWNPDRADIAAYSWDLEHIETTNRWEILPVERNGLDPSILHPLKDTPGTVVLWQKLDRILGYKHPYGEFARKRLLQMCRDMELHLGMVFHRFLTGEARGKRLNLMLNGNEIKPWDAFCRTEEKTRRLQSVQLPVEQDGANGKVLIEPYIVPREKDFSSPDAFKRASGPANWNQQQGFYIYRAGRMIQSGGWSKLRAPDEHTKLARIAVSFLPSLDDAFKINVAKMRVQLPSQIRDEVRETIGPVVRLAREIYDRKPVGVNPLQHFSPPETTTELSPGTGQPDTFAAAKIDVPGPSFHPLLSFEEWSERVMTIATAEERPVIETVLRRLHDLVVETETA